MSVSQQQLTGKVFKNPINFLAFGFGSGLLPKAPGTWGTLVALPIYYVMQNLSTLNFVALTLVLTLIGIYICDYCSKKLKVHDHPGIVWDEICGYLITMIAAPAGWLWMLIGFVLFRIFDILKPWPIKWLDKKVKGGFGIMIDDVLAGIFALALLQLIAFIAL